MNDILVIILFSIILLWFFHVLQRIFYYLYIWQLKEYRIDRFWEEVSRNKFIIFPKTFFLAFVLFLFHGLLEDGSEFAFIPYLFIIFAFFLIFGLRSLLLLLRHSWKLPKFTWKMIILTTLTLIFIFGSVLLTFSDNIRFILFLEIFLPVFIFIPVLVIQIPTFFAKRHIFKLARKKRESFKDLIVIGITGSYGKSSTKEFLNTILSEKYNVLKTEGNVNTEIGIANTVLSKLTKEHQVFICEMGAYKRGEIKKSCSIVMPKIGILTGINQQHLALFGSQENIVKAKFELLEALPSNGVAVVNYDNDLIKSKVKSQNSRIQAKIQNYSLKDASLANLPQADRQNILAAITVAKELELTGEEISKGLEKIKPSLIIKKGINGINIIDSSYSANPSGIMAHLDYLKTFSGNRIIIMPCLIELGSVSKEVHQQIGKKIGEVCDLAIITTRGNFDDIISGSKLIEIGYPLIANTTRTVLVEMENPREIFEKIKGFAKEGDVILIESRVPVQLIKSLLL